MRIVVVSAWDPARITDGSALVLFHHLRTLSARHDVHVLTADRVHTDATARLAVDVERVGDGMPAAVDYLTRRAWSLGTGEPAHVRYVERPALRRRLRELVATWNPDVAYLVGWGTARLWRDLDGVPAVHAAIDPWWLNFEVRPRGGIRRLVEAGERRRVARHEARHYPELAAVTLVSDEDARELRARTGARVEVVPNGVEPGPEPTSLPGGRVVGFHGNLSAAPNAAAARWCVETLAPVLRDRGARLRIIGREPPAWLRRAAGVEVTGEVPDVREALDDVDVYVAPMTTGAGLKNKILEAMAAGRPVVTTPLGAQGIGAGDGLAVVPLDELTGQVLWWLDAPEEAASVGRAARARVVADFSWDESGRRIEDLLAGAASAVPR